MSVKIITGPVSHDQLVGMFSEREFEGFLVAGVRDPDPLAWICSLRILYPGRALPVAILHSREELTVSSVVQAAKHFREAGAGARRGGSLLRSSLLIDQPSRQVVVDGAQKRFSPEEFRLLLFLIRHSDVVFSREELLYRTRPPESAVDPRMVDVLIRRLRRNIDKNNKIAPSHIVTVHGIGYRFTRLHDEFIDGFTGRSFESWPCCTDPTCE